MQELIKIILGKLKKEGLDTILFLALTVFVMFDYQRRVESFEIINTRMNNKLHNQDSTLIQVNQRMINLTNEFKRLQDNQLQVIQFLNGLSNLPKQKARERDILLQKLLFTQPISYIGGVDTLIFANAQSPNTGFL